MSATPVVTNPSTTIGRVGHRFEYSILATNGPTYWNAVGLPTDLILNSFGVITGVPQGTFTGTVTLTAGNDAGEDTQDVTLTVT